MSKTSFILHIDSLKILDELTNEQKGILFDAIYRYHLGEEPELDFAMRLAFVSFRNQFVRDKEKYDEFSKKQSQNGSLGGRPPKNPQIPKKPKPFSETQQNPENPQEPKKAYSDSIKDSVSDSENLKDSSSETESEKELPLPPPPPKHFRTNKCTPDEMLEYVHKQHNLMNLYKDASCKRSVEWFLKQLEEMIKLQSIKGSFERYSAGSILTFMIEDIQKKEKSLQNTKNMFGRSI